MNANTQKINWLENINENDIDNALENIEIDWTESVIFDGYRIDNMEAN